MTLVVTIKGLDKLLRDLEKARKTAVPYAIRETLNNAAFETRREWQGAIGRTFVQRTQFTQRSIQVKRATLSRQFSVVGSVAPYMAQIEQDTIRTGHSHHKPIPTAAAAGLAPGSRRTKLVRAANALRAIQAAKATAASKSRQQRNAIAMSIARKRREKFVLLERKGGGKGLFQFRPRIAPRMVWDLSRGSVHVAAHRTLEPALLAVAPRLEAVAMNAMLRQLRFHGLLGF